MTGHPDDPDRTNDDEAAVVEAFGPLLAKLSEGDPIDWAADTTGLPDVDPALLRALKDIAAIDEAHRAAESAFADARGPLASNRWRHLTILEPIGEGRFGTVHRAFDTVLQIDVALKLSPLTSAEPFDASALLAEARLLAKVQHPHVVRIYGVDETEGRAGIWMEWIPGRTLDAIVGTAPLSEAEAIDIGIQLSQALAAVHAVNVLHGDIKAHNVIRRENGDVVLVDFGAGRRLTPARPKGIDVAGTLVYMAPEVLRGDPRSQASDVYSLGVLLFYLVTGQYPVSGDSLEQTRELHERGQGLRLREIRPTTSRGFASLVERATSIDPQGRVASARALEAELRRLRQHAPMRSKMAAAGLVLATAVAVWSFSSLRWPRTTSVPSATPAASDAVPVGSSGSEENDTFDVEATFFRVHNDGTSEPLRQDQTIGVDDELRLSIRASAPIHVYVINEDENGEAYLLFPLPNRGPGNPLPADTQVNLPDGLNWKVTSAGGKEHFVVLASRQQQDAFERGLRELPPPTEEGPTRVAPSLLDRLRGVGGLGRLPSTTPASTYHTVFTTPLGGREHASGLWGRRLTLLNPGREF